MLRPMDLSVIPHKICHSPITNRVTSIPLVTPDQVLNRLRRAKEMARNPQLIIADLRETRLYQLGHVITAISTNCYTKTMAKRAIGLWDSIFARYNGCPAKNTEDQDVETLFCSPLPQTTSTCVVVYDQLGDYLPNEMSRDSPVYFFLSHLLERGNFVLFMVGGFNAFQSLRSHDFIDCSTGATATTNCHQPQLKAPTAGPTVDSLTAVRSSPTPSPSLSLSGRDHHQARQQNTAAGSYASGLNLLTLVNRSALARQKRAGAEDGSAEDQTIADVMSARVSKILPFLYLGNARDAQNLELLCQLSVTHIVNVTDTVPMPFTSCTTTSPPFVYLHLPASDTSQQDLRPAFERAVKFISDARKNRGIVLVHCQAGVSRSVAVVMAYLLHLNPSLSVLDALEFVQNRRSVAGPNLHFMGQLQRYRSELDQRSHSAPPHPLSAVTCSSPPDGAVVDSLFADIDFQFEA